MANVTARCDLMQNAFPAGPLSLQGKFHVVEDTNGEHMIFSIDKRGKLCLVVKGDDGHNELINLSTSLALSDSSKITALAVTQSRRHLVHLAFAVNKSDGCDELYVMKPMPAERRGWLDPAALRAALYMGQQSNVSISDILMGNGNDRTDAEYPELYLTVKLAGKSTQDIWAITVSNSTASWQRENLFQMTVNVDKIVSMCVGNIGNPKFKTLYRGLFVLYEQASSIAPLQLRFVGLDFGLATPSMQSFELPVPANARLVASFDNPEGFTDLFICADTVLWRSAVDCFTKAQTPYQKPLAYHSSAEMTSPEPMAALSLKQVSVVQAGDKVSLWTLDQSSLLSYQEFQVFPKPTSDKKTPQSPPQELSPPIPLLERSSNSASFASIQNPRFGQKLFVINDNSMTMSMLQQSVETRIWQAPIDVMIPDSDEIREFMSHTISIQIEDESKMPLNNQELVLCCSTSAEMLVNGVSARGSPVGTVVKTDEQGSLTVIIPADGIAAPVLAVKDVPGSSNPLGGRTINIDPMQKLWDQMAQITTVKDLRNLKLPDGTSFVNVDMSEKDLEKAVKAIQDLNKARQDLGSRDSHAVTTMTGHADRQWGAWFWIKTRIQEAYEWAVEKIGAAYKFIIKIAGKVWEFIVENFPQIAAVLQKILEVISKGWEWVKQRFEEVFPWNDIFSVKNALVNITTAGVILGSDVFASLESKVDECFGDLRKKVRSLKDKTLPKELTDIRFSKDPPMPNGMEKNEVTDLIKSPQMQYGVYHLRHSASKQSDSGMIGPRSEGETSFDRLFKRLSGIWDSVTALAVRFGANIADLFSNKEFDLNTLIAKVGLEFVEDALVIMQRAVTALLGSLSDLLLELTDAMNADIKIPVIGPLYSKLTQGSRFTALDVICLLLAIPSTIAYKKIIGPLPKEDKGYQQLVQPNALKGALDLRMGRIKSGEVLSRPLSGPNGLASIQMMSFHHIDETPQVLKRMSSQEVNEKTSNGADRENAQHAKKNNQESAETIKHPSESVKMTETTTLQNNMINIHQTQGGKAQFNGIGASRDIEYQAVIQKARVWWVEVGKPCSKILKVMFPAASLLYTVAYKLPKAMVSGEKQGIKRSLSGLLMKLVLWVGHGVLVCFPKFKDTSKEFWSLAEAAFNDVVFGWKFIIWTIPGFFPIAGHVINEYVGCCAEAVAGITQTIALMAMHVDVYAIAKASYPWYRCPEEYLNVLAKVAVAAAVMTKGKEPWSLGFAFGLTTVGKHWTLIRTGIEKEPDNNDDGKYNSSALDDTV